MNTENTSRENILVTARSLFSRFGYHAVSTRRITSTLGVSNGMLYFLFPSKKSLLGELVDRFKDAWIAAIPESHFPDQSPESGQQRILQSVIHKFIRRMLDLPELRETWTILLGLRIVDVDFLLKWGRNCTRLF